MAYLVDKGPVECWASDPGRKFSLFSKPVCPRPDFRLGSLSASPDDAAAELGVDSLKWKWKEGSRLIQLSICKHVKYSGIVVPMSVMKSELLQMLSALKMSRKNILLWFLIWTRLNTTYQVYQCLFHYAWVTEHICFLLNVPWIIIHLEIFKNLISGQN